VKKKKNQTNEVMGGKRDHVEKKKSSWFIIDTLNPTSNESIAPSQHTSTYEWIHHIALNSLIRHTSIH
tara:strand:+ start:934 stop:1137 length:204 start_codon:yes stop_codon:yes gene_type:complete